MLVTFEAGKGTEVYGHRTEKAEDIKQLRDTADGKFIDMKDGRYFSITERSYKDILRNTSLIQEHTHKWYITVQDFTEGDACCSCQCGVRLNGSEAVDILNGKG